MIPTKKISDMIIVDKKNFSNLVLKFFDRWRMVDKFSRYRTVNFKVMSNKIKIIINSLLKSLAGHFF